MEEPNTTAAPTPVSGTLRYVDRPDCTETFADCIMSSPFDDQTLRLEFGITRLDEAASAKSTDKPAIPNGRTRCGPRQKPGATSTAFGARWARALMFRGGHARAEKGTGSSERTGL
jgi:hypothetical protein